MLLVFGLNACVKKPIIEVKGDTDFSNWMQDLILRYPKKSILLKDICLPKAHDAGMYELNNC